MEMDHNTGRVLDALDTAGIRDNTIVVWISDNGPMRDTVWPDSGFAGPFRGELGDPWEGSIRTAGMIAWPGKIKPRVSNEMFSIMDLYPTLAKLAGARVPSDRPFDGIDQSDFVLGKQENSNRESFITFTGDDLQAVRWRQFRIYFSDVVPVGTGPSSRGGLSSAAIPLNGYPLIFNIERDPREEHNISTTHGWVVGYALQIIAEYKESLVKHPNPPAPNLTNW
jgi:arylsulfatase